MKKILVVVGTRPNFIKVTQLKKVNEAMGNPFELKIVHTGQHYDDKMATVFEQFDLVPDYFLNIPATSANNQMAEIMIRLEKVMLEFKPQLVMVVGDVNSTFAAALTANKMGAKIAHIESGLRSSDRSMPEEINRILTDEITDYYFVTEESGIKNLRNEKNRNKDHIFFVGNTMIDTLVAFESKIAGNEILNDLHIKPKDFALMTMHRPATVDHKEGLLKLIEIIEFITNQHHLVFPIHPRTLKNLDNFGLTDRIKSNKKLILTEPLDYFGFQKLISDCLFVITDSGGIQEETTFRRIPCLTLRPNTERPSTVDVGTNELIPFDLNAVNKKIEDILKGNFKKGRIPDFWDGASSRRILEICKKLVEVKNRETVLS